MSAIESVLVPGCLKLASNSRSGGVTVNKGGYHSTRAWLRANKPNDYSIQTARDHDGPGDEGSAFDWVFDDARGGDFRTIAKFSRRLYEAGKNHDKRAYPLREFYGNTDLDREVEGWSYYRDRAGSSDSSHLWHIHFSIWRKYINDANAMRSILSILSGGDSTQEDDMPSLEEIADYLARDTEFTQAVAVAAWQKDGTVNNVGFAAGTEGSFVSGSDALEAILKRIMQTKADVGALDNQLKALDDKLNAIIASLK